jgi:hypothetical protein
LTETPYEPLRCGMLFEWEDHRPWNLLVVVVLPDCVVATAFANIAVVASHWWLRR